MKKLENLQKYINACEDNMSIAEKEQALENIRKISDDILCKEEKEEI